MATAQVKKLEINLNKSQSEAIQVGFSAFSFQQFIERVWKQVFPILETSQVVLSTFKQMHLLAGKVNQPSILRNVSLTNNEHEVAFAALPRSQKFSHHTYTSIHHNEPSISSIITLRS